MKTFEFPYMLKQYDVLTCAKLFPNKLRFGPNGIEIILPDGNISDEIFDKTKYQECEWLIL